MYDRGYTKKNQVKPGFLLLILRWYPHPHLEAYRLTL